MTRYLYARARVATASKPAIPPMEEDIVITAPSEPRAAVRHGATTPAGAPICDARVITDNETAHILQCKLGSIRAWSDFLCDCRRGKADLHGHMLMPACVMVIGRSKRPMYRVSDIRDFINAMHALGVGMAPTRVNPLKVQLNLVETDWRKRKFDTFGRPVAGMGIAGRGYGA